MQISQNSTILTAMLALPLVLGPTALANEAAAGMPGGVVFVMTNKAEGNSVLVYRRAANGGLQQLQEVPTQGLGTGVTNDPLMSQGALALRRDGKLLLAVNPASGDVTAFVVTPTGLVFGSKASSGGALPVSVTVNGGLVYVLNQLGIPNISGFTVDDTGHFQPISGSTRALAGGALALPAEVSFTPDGMQLLVTEKGTDQIDIFDMQADGRTIGPAAQPSSGKTPFGFAFAPFGTVVVSEAERRLPQRATTSSYRLTGGDALVAVSSAVPDGQTAACWVAVTGQTAWVVNTGTATISSYGIGADGALTLLNPVAASTGHDTSPIDVAATSDGGFIYVLESAVGAITGYQVNGSSLTPLFTATGLPLSIQGIAAR